MLKTCSKEDYVRGHRVICCHADDIVYLCVNEHKHKREREHRLILDSNTDEHEYFTYADALKADFGNEFIDYLYCEDAVDYFIQYVKGKMKRESFAHEKTISEERAEVEFDFLAPTIRFDEFVEENLNTSRAEVHVGDWGARRHCLTAEMKCSSFPDKPKYIKITDIKIVEEFSDENDEFTNERDVIYDRVQKKIVQHSGLVVDTSYNKSYKHSSYTYEMFPRLFIQGSF